MDKNVIYHSCIYIYLEKKFLFLQENNEGFFLSKWNKKLMND